MHDVGFSRRSCCTAPSDSTRLLRGGWLENDIYKVPFRADAKSAHCGEDHKKFGTSNFTIPDGGCLSAAALSVNDRRPVDEFDHGGCPFHRRLASTQSSV